MTDSTPSPDAQQVVNNAIAEAARHIELMARDHDNQDFEGAIAHLAQLAATTDIDEAAGRTLKLARRCTAIVAAQVAGVMLRHRGPEPNAPEAASADHYGPVTRDMVKAIKGQSRLIRRLLDDLDNHDLMTGISRAEDDLEEYYDLRNDDNGPSNNETWKAMTNDALRYVFMQEVLARIEAGRMNPDAMKAQAEE